jgi:hypothetical protein
MCVSIFLHSFQLVMYSPTFVLPHSQIDVSSLKLLLFNLFLSLPFFLLFIYVVTNVGYS